MPLMVRSRRRTGTRVVLLPRGICRVDRRTRSFAAATVCCPRSGRCGVPVDGAERLTCMDCGRTLLAGADRFGRLDGHDSGGSDGEACAGAVHRNGGRWSPTAERGERSERTERRNQHTARDMVAAVAPRWVNGSVEAATQNANRSPAAIPESTETCSRSAEARARSDPSTLGGLT